MTGRAVQRAAEVSIRAPRAGGDFLGSIVATAGAGFNPRPPCGGRRDPQRHRILFRAFQSAPPVRGATTSGRGPGSICTSFNPRPPCGGRLGPSAFASPANSFNPRPPCGGRPSSWIAVCPERMFQSAPPVRGATLVFRGDDERPPVSIRAPRAGGDRQVPALCTGINRFNPRPPCGGRRNASGGREAARMFQSAPPVRGATPALDVPDDCKVVSIRAPRAGGDVLPRPRDTPIQSFNPRPPCGGRLVRQGISLWLDKVSIRAPRAGGDVRSSSISGTGPCFNPRPPCGGRLSTSTASTAQSPFQSAPPVRGATRLTT